MVSIGDRLREERERLGLKQDELGVAPKTQRFYESGERSPDAAYLAHFAELGADVLYILTGQRTVLDLKPDEAALLDNYRHTPPEKQQAVREVGAAFAQYQAVAHAARKKGNGN